MSEVKNAVKELVTVMAEVKNEGLSYSDRLHTVIIGNTGTDKTKLVNILASLHHQYGVTKTAIPVICDAVDFVDFSSSPSGRP